MTKVLVTEAYLDNIADAIRAKANVSTEYKPSQMAGAIMDIDTHDTHDATASAGDVLTGKTAYIATGKVSGTMPNQGAIAGTIDAENPSYTVPEGYHSGLGTVSADVATTAEFEAYVGRIKKLVPKTITENGTYNAEDDNVGGYSQVTVNVPPEDPFADLTAYIESSGTQYINTGYSIAANTRFEVVANVPDNSSTYPALFGARTGTSDEVVVFVEFSGGNIAMVWANGDSAFDPNFWHRGYIGAKCEYVLGAAGEIGIRDADNNGFKGTKTTGTGTSLPIYLFALNENSSPNSVTYCAAKLYRFRVYEGDALVMELLPFVDGNSVACLKDTVSGDLFYNSGSGSFTYGTDA